MFKSFSQKQTQCQLEINVCLSALCVVISTEAAPKKDSCQIPCTSDYSPICGKPAEGKGTDITFGNKCVLDNYNCEKKDKRKLSS